MRQIPFLLEGPRINFVAKKDFGQIKNINFCRHMDVVTSPNDECEKWRFPPFEATMIKSGKIYGTGVVDNIGAMIYLLL